MDKRGWANDITEVFTGKKAKKTISYIGEKLKKRARLNESK